MAPQKKGHSSSAKTRINVFSGLKDELKQVTWPTRQEAVQLTATVITISLIVALFVGIIDFSLAKILEILSQR
ncbi:preprotein translocase subunit SecE [Candidatus Woesebacteria bacterium]|nr:preprotein translocase subunit SecE [Candidatus Woesebacteria bacterium]